MKSDLNDSLVVVVAGRRPVAVVARRRRHEDVRIVFLRNDEKKRRRIVRIGSTFDLGKCENGFLKNELKITYYMFLCVPHSATFFLPLLTLHIPSSI